jgi:hypothetical protein
VVVQRRLGDTDPLGDLAQTGLLVPPRREELPAGALNPTTVFVRSDSGPPLDPAALQQYAGTLARVPGVGSVLPAGADGDRSGEASGGIEEERVPVPVG